jgi:hypothetical protein
MMKRKWGKLQIVSVLGDYNHPSAQLIASWNPLNVKGV